MGFFKKKTPKSSYDTTGKTPAIKCSICNGEQVAGFRDPDTGVFEEIMLIRCDEDLIKFKSTFNITGDIPKIY